MPDINKIIAWESGELSHEEEVEFFTQLVRSGYAWKLQGCYGRRAMQLIEAGEIHG